MMPTSTTLLLTTSTGEVFFYIWLLGKHDASTSCRHGFNAYLA